MLLLLRTTASQVNTRKDFCLLHCPASYTSTSSSPVADCCIFLNWSSVWFPDETWRSFDNSESGRLSVTVSGSVGESAGRGLRVPVNRQKQGREVLSYSPLRSSYRLRLSSDPLLSLSIPWRLGPGHCSVSPFPLLTSSSLRWLAVRRSLEPRR